MRPEAGELRANLRTLPSKVPNDDPGGKAQDATRGERF